MKRMRRRALTVFASMAVFLCLSTAASAAEEITVEIGKIVENTGNITTEDIPSEYEYEGKIYELARIIVDEREKKTLTRETEKMLKYDDSSLPKLLEADGVAYELIDIEESVEASGKRYVTASCERERDGKEELALPSLTKDVEDPDTGEIAEAVLPLTESVEKSEIWKADFQTELTFTPDGADYYAFMGKSYEVTEDPLPETAWPDILAWLGLSSDEYRITSVVWTGKEEGHLTAGVSGESLHRIYTDRYEGSVELASIDYITLTGTYAETDESYQTSVLAEGKAVYYLEEVSAETVKNTDETVDTAAETETTEAVESTDTGKHGILVPALASAGAVLITAGAVALIIIYKRKRRN